METREEKTTEPGTDKTTFTALPSSKDGDGKGQYVGYYIGKETASITKLKTILGMVPGA